MKTSILSAVLLMCICFKLYAQQPIDELIAAEKSFAATSKEQTTKIAFLAFLDSNCVGYDKGLQTKMFKEWTDRKESSSKLTWNPEFAFIAASGELGITTGPWEFRQTSLKDTPVAHCHFTTVWKKKENGIWKAMFDMGIGYDAPSVSSDEVKVKTVVLDSATKSKNTEDWLLIDKSFSNDKATLLSLLDKDAWISIQGHAPLKDPAAIKSTIDIVPTGLQFKHAGYFMSESKDLLAVYGPVIKDDKHEQSFLRVWVKRENKWKLMILVIK